MKTSINRIKKIDLLKGLAIILMVVGHLINKNENLSIVLNLIYSFHMPLLFFSSGYLIGIKDINYRNMGKFKFLKKKSSAVLIPYFTWAVLIPWIKEMGNLKILKELLVRAIGIYGGGIWFLPVLYGLLLMYLLWSDINEKIKISKRYFFNSIISYGCTFLILLIFVIFTRYPYAINMLSYNIPFFIGIFLAQNDVLNKIFKNKQIIIVSSILYVLLFLQFDFGDLSIFTQVKRIILSVFMIIILWNLFNIGNYNSIFLRYVALCGENSLAIYLVHGYFTRWRYILTKMDSMALAICISLILSFTITVICIMIAKIFECNNITKKIFLGK